MEVLIENVRGLCRSKIATMKILLFFQIFVISWCDSVVKEYLDAVEKFGRDEMVAEYDAAQSGSYGSGGPTSNYVNKDHYLAFKEFKKEVDYINGNKGIPFNAEINKFSILTESERQLYNGLNISMFLNDQVHSSSYGSYQSRPSFGTLGRNKLPDSIDWEKKGAQVPIKHQGKCGSCWAYAAAAAIEALYFQTTGDLVSFADQEILDCAYEENRPGYNGCKGGWLDRPFEYVKNANRLACSRDAKYVGQDRKCNYRNVPNSLTKAKIVGFKNYKTDRGLQEALSQNPAAVAVFTARSFYSYRNGIYRDPGGCKQQATHAMTAIGYGKAGGMNFWRVRNSWGTQWGEMGYIRFTRDIPNHCRVSQYTVMPLMECRTKGGCKSGGSSNRSVCSNTWTDAFCNRSAIYCRGARNGNWKKLQLKLQKVCKKTCKMCN